MDKKIIIGIVIIVALILILQAKKEVGEQINFRTSDLSYASAGAIAYTSTCGNTLTAYGHYGSTGNLNGDCATGSKTWCGASSILILSDLPGGWKSGGANPSLWKPTETEIICVCDDDSSSYTLKKYSTGDSDKSKVDISSASIDLSKEIACGPCTPSCSGKVCGDDGCGGSCGLCEEGYTCSSGQCITSGSCWTFNEMVTQVNDNWLSCN